MTRYVALLGSINVGGNRLKMVELREALEREDFADVYDFQQVFVRDLPW